jgi:hypothetical protein
MTEKLPLIISAKQSRTEKVPAGGIPILECEVMTEDGPRILRLTSNAAHDLRAMLENPPPRLTPGARRI